MVGGFSVPFLKIPLQARVIILYLTLLGAVIEANFPIRVLFHSLEAVIPIASLLRFAEALLHLLCSCGIFSTYIYCHGVFIFWNRLDCGELQEIDLDTYEHLILFKQFFFLFFSKNIRTIAFPFSHSKKSPCTLQSERWPTRTHRTCTYIQQDSLWWRTVFFEALI